MALTTKRIIALPSQTAPQEGDYLAIDNATSGTHKIPVGRIGVEVDDTLTEAGKAADAKAVGDALGEIRSQIEVTGTASGAIATFTDGSDNPMKSCMVTIEPKQSGTGTPSPDNVRPISGWTEVEVIVSPTQEATDGHTTTTSLGRTVYGGTLDVVSGVLTVTKGYRLFDNSVSCYSVTTNYGTGFNRALYSTLENEAKRSIETPILSDKFSYTNRSALGLYAGNINNNSMLCLSVPDTITTTAEMQAWAGQNPFVIVYELATPTTYQLTPTQINTLLGDNNVWADSGDIEVVYIRDLNITINNLLSGSGTRSLGMMAMSAPTEEQTDEQTDELSEDDMR